MVRGEKESQSVAQPDTPAPWSSSRRKREGAGVAPGCRVTSSAGAHTVAVWFDDGSHNAGGRLQLQWTSFRGAGEELRDFECSDPRER